MLIESVTSTAPGETLDEKLAALTFPHSDDCESRRDPNVTELSFNDNNHSAAAKFGDRGVVGHPR